jgi:hypothetical protein
MEPVPMIPIPIFFELIENLFCNSLWTFPTTYSTNTKPVH